MASFDRLALELSELRKQNRYRTICPRDATGATFQAHGQTVINFGSNDYLGLGSLRMLATRSAELPSHGSGASTLVSGWTSLHETVADLISDWESTEATIVFPSGYAACSGVIATLPGPNDLVLSDQLNHASIIDGCRLAQGGCNVFPHRDWRAVRQMLFKHRSRYDQVWIVTDGVFSMDGSVAPLVELVGLAEQFDAVLIVDEAHGTGVVGPTGCGVCEAMGVRDQVPIRIGTLSKAIGSQGGFVTGPRMVIDYLINRCRSLIYSTSLSPLATAAAIDGIRAIQDQPQRRDRVQRLSARVRSRLQIPAHGLEASIPIIPVILGDDDQAIACSQKLLDEAMYVPAIRPPTVPEGTSRLRISLSAEHTDEMIDHLITAVSELR